MSEIIQSSTLLPVVSKVSINVRLATMADVPFMDALQKKHTKALGYFPTKQFEGYIEMGGVLIAECDGVPVGYCISRDRYLKRDELGVIYQLCVNPGEQRKLIGASLIQAVFDRSAYGCRLYCCWCAQDLAANYFWESLGFVPIAFRGGSDKKTVRHGSRQGRVHIFWQKKIRQDDTTTPWWFPAKTESGAMRADRLVLPTPAGLHWSDPMPVLTPMEGAEQNAPVKRAPRAKKPAPMVEPVKPKMRAPVQFGPPEMGPIAPVEPVQEPIVTKVDALPAVKVARVKTKVDPKLVSAARELRDRWLEKVNTGQFVLEGRARYQLGRDVLPERAALLQLPHAA